MIEGERLLKKDRGKEGEDSQCSLYTVMEIE
jgi:hypothetical protein